MNTLFDASSLINLTNGGLLDVVLDLAGKTWFMGPTVLDECKYRNVLPPVLQDAIDDHRITVLDASTINGTAYLSLLSRFNLGLGETECLAFAINDDYIVCCDDKKARQVLARQIGNAKVTGSLGLLREAVNSGLLTAAEAMNGYLRMKGAGAFIPDIDKTFFT